MKPASRQLSGSVWLLGDNINTDIIHPPDYFSLDEETVKAGLAEGMRRMHATGPQPSAGGDIIIVAGENFGCGSSRETSVRALAAWNVRAVLARSFARIFFRSLINLGIYALCCDTLQTVVRRNQQIIINLTAQTVCPQNGAGVPFTPPDLHVKRVLDFGGLVPYLQNEIRQERKKE